MSDKIKVEDILTKHITITNPAGLRVACKELIELAIDKAAENAECEDDAIVDLGFEIISANVKKESILNVKQMFDYS